MSDRDGGRVWGGGVGFGDWCKVSDELTRPVRRDHELEILYTRVIERSTYPVSLLIA